MSAASIVDVEQIRSAHCPSSAGSDGTACAWAAERDTGARCAELETREESAASDSPVPAVRRI